MALYTNISSNDTQPDGLSKKYFETEAITEDVMRALYYLIGSVGLTGNLLVIVVMVSTKNLSKKVSSLYIVNLAVTDFLTAFFLLMTTALPHDRRVYKNTTDYIYCCLWTTRAPFWIFMMSSTWSLVALTIERYVAVVYPLKYKCTFTTMKAGVSILILWVTAFTYTTPSYFATSKIMNGTCKHYMFQSDNARTARGVIHFLVNYGIPLMVLVFSYTRMAKVFSVKVGPLGRQVDENNQIVKKNIIKTLAIVSGAFIVSVSVNQWYFLLFNVGAISYETHVQVSTFRKFTVISMFANCCMNPIIYAAQYKLFQDGLRKRFCSLSSNC